MSDKLRAAAARLTGRAIEYYRKDRAVAQREIDIVDLAEAYLAANPVDDGDPVTEDFLDSCFPGRELSQEESWWLSLELWIGSGTYGYSLMHTGANGSGSFILVLDIPTRGGLRRLCAALGIPLTEAIR